MDVGRDAAEFCREIRPRLVGSLALYCGDRSLGEELAHEAIVRALERWDRVREFASPEAWVFRVGFNLAKSSRQRRMAEQRATQRLAARGVEHTQLPDSRAASSGHVLKGPRTSSSTSNADGASRSRATSS